MKIDTQLKEAYFSEAKEYLKVMNVALLSLEKFPKKTVSLSNIQDAVHTLKSMSATMQYEKTATLCHNMEDALEEIKSKKVKLEYVVDLLFECFDTLEASVRKLEKNEEELETSELIDRLKNVISSSTGSQIKSGMTKETREESKRQHIIKSDTIQVKVERLDTLMKLAEEMLIAKMRLDRLKEEQEENLELGSAVDSLNRLVTDMQYHITQARMVPIGMIFERFPRMVRDLAKQEKKQVNLVMEGSEIELDRQVLGQIGEPLVHLLRNAIDHGIEMPDARKKQGKPAEATLKLKASREKGVAIIEVEDDGNGLDLVAIKNAAIKKDLLTSNASPEEVLLALFSGLSTTQKVTTVSGRGLGLGIVKKTIDTMGGNIKVESKPRVSTKFIIELPLTLAIVNTLFVKVAGGTYAIPVSNVVRMLTVSEKDIKGQFGTEALVLDGEDLPLVSLRGLFHYDDVIPESAERIASMTEKHLAISDQQREVVIVRKGEERFGLGVDAFVATQEIVIKPLDRMVRGNKYFSGSTIIGSGDAVLVLDVANLAVLKKVEKTRRKNETH